MRVCRFLAVAALTAALAVMAGEGAYADDPPAKQDKKAKLKAALKAAKAAETAKAANIAKAANAAKPPAGPAPSAAALAALIDEHVNRKLAEGRASVAPAASDEEFLRRAYLDITGVIPSADRAKAFLDGTDPDKRAKLVDELLASPEYGKHQADIWYGLVVQRSSDNRRIDFGPTRDWFAAAFNENRPWDAVVTDVLTATGTMGENGAVGFYLSNNTVDKMTDACGTLFLGQQIQCAQCHNHPFTATKQTEYWELAQFFFKVETGNIKAKGADPNVREVPRPKRGKDGLPEAAKVLPAKFPGGAAPKMAPADPARPVLAKWLTAADNPFFARAMVNRTWAQFLGRGFVNPVDDLSAENAPSHPDLLDALSREFATGFDLKHLIRGICTSRAYGRTSKRTGGAAEHGKNELFGRMAVKVMTPEQLFDSLVKATGRDVGEGGGKGKNGVVAAGPRERFVNFFLAGADTASLTEYEAGIPQALKLMNSPVTGNLLALRNVAPPGTRPAEAVERIYLTALSRRPSDAERKRLAEYVGKNGPTPATYGDILWAVLNSSEFTLVR